jgi:nucleoside-diphosphate-sugar epimerase/aryl carrier-like protein
MQRRAAIKLYEQELNAVYERDENPSTPEARASVGPWDESSLQQSVLDIVQHIHGLEGATPSTNLLDLGLDSLQVMTITRRTKVLLAKLGKLSVQFTNRTVYANPSVDKLVAALLGTDHLPNGTTQISESLPQKLQRLYEHYTAELPLSARLPVPAPDIGKTVLLTGSTGSLGSYILETLLHDPRIRNIYCLNRSRDSHERQLGSHRSKGLSTAFPPNRVRFLECDLSAPYFKLAPSSSSSSDSTPASEPKHAKRSQTQQLYIELLQTVTDIIHNAWPVDFNLPLEHIAQTHLRGVRQLVEFSVHSRHGARIVFVSSIGAVSNYRPTLADPTAPIVVPEKIIADAASAGPVGYAQSKYLAEQILAAAYDVARVPAAIVRVGQIAGPAVAAAGIWPKSEWFPSMLASSANVIRKLPLALPGMDLVNWIPIDKCAGVVVELMFDTGMSTTGVDEDDWRGADMGSDTMDDSGIGWGAESQDGRGSVANSDDISTMQGGIDANGGSGEEMGLESQRSESGVKETGIPVYHAVNPCVTTWEALLPTVKTALGIEDVVTFTEWMDLLRKSAGGTGVDAETVTETDTGQANGNENEDTGENRNETAAANEQGRGDKNGNDTTNCIQDENAVRSGDKEAEEGADATKAIEVGDANKDSALRNPALKLLEFFEDMERHAEAGRTLPRFALGQSMQKSETLAGLEVVTPELMQMWLRQWSF